MGYLWDIYGTSPPFHDFWLLLNRKKLGQGWIVNKFGKDVEVGDEWINILM
jgi:hypothetical protein